MATTSNTYTGNGSNKLFSITFPYLETTDVDVYLNGTLQTITTQYTFANATTIEFVAAPANGAVVLLDRSTDDATLQATFFPGSSIKAADLNLDFDQVLYIAQETSNEATTATSTAASATTTANTALSQSSAAVSTANTASSNASAAVSTANTASTNASNAVTTANTASSNATTAVNTANAATSTANTASSNASAAVSTANTASSNASAAVSTANTASTNASAAVSTANTASTNASTAVTTANNAVTTANSAVTTANTANTNSNTAVTTANAAAAAVANAVLYTTVANVAAIPGSPANNAAVEVTNSTGIESFTPLSGLPAGFIGSSGLSVRIIYQTSGATWTWIQYFPNDPESRYLKLAGGTLTGALTLAADPSTALQPATKQYTDAADALKLAKAGDTMTGALVHPLGAAATPSVTFTGDTNTGLYSPGADQVGITTGGTVRLTTTTTGITSALPVDVPLGAVGTPSITFTGDLNTGIYSPAADTLAFVEGGVEAMRIDSSGRLGIGTSAPTSTLHVQHPAQTTNYWEGKGLLIHEDANANQGIAFYSRAGSEQYIASLVDDANSYLIIGTRKSSPTNGVDAITIRGDGKVGIGTASPNQLLQINSSSVDARIQITNSATGSTNSDGFHLQVNSSDVYFDNKEGGNFVFQSGATEAARIDSSRRLLVGTSTARSNFFNSSFSAGLQLEGTDTNRRLAVIGVDNSPFLILSRQNSGSVGGNAVVASGNTVGSLTFQGNDGSEFVEAATINCEVDGTPGANDMPGRLVFSTTADGASSPTERMRIDKDGVLNCLGVYTFTTASAANVVISSGGNFNRSTSSVKYKTDVETVQDLYSDALLQCRPVWYRSTCSNDNPDWGWWGFIAEEVAAIDPRLVHWKTKEVSHDDKGAVVVAPSDPEPEGVQYDRFVPHLLNLIKRQKEQIEAMDARLSALEGA
jgi:hypothetical protein